jgi:broad specificity phosphatase PhoE
MRLIVLVRHAHSTLNLEGRVNGDPAVHVPLTDTGRAQAATLGLQLTGMPLDLCIHTRFGRTAETARIALRARDVPFLVEPRLDDIDVGDMEGQTIDDYHAWKRMHRRSDPFPGGESLDDAARRYSAAFRDISGHDARAILVVCHEIPIRYALNAAGGSDDLDGPAHAIPNATPYLFDHTTLAAAATRIEALVPAQRESSASSAALSSSDAASATPST